MNPLPFAWGGQLIPQVLAKWDRCQESWSMVTVMSLQRSSPLPGAG